MTHLHVHSDHSYLDGYQSTREIIEKVKQLGHKAIANTDHGEINNAFNFFSLAKENGIKPIIGVEAYCLTREEFISNKENKNRPKFEHFIILAKNKQGYKNLLKLNTKANEENFYYKPVIFYEDLWENNEGLITTSACLAGKLNKLRKYSDKGIANKQLNYWYGNMLDAMGDRFFLELQFHNSNEQAEYNNMLIKLANGKKFPKRKLVITSDAHYINRDDILYHYLLVLMNMSKGSTTREFNEREFEEKQKYANFLASEEDIKNLNEEFGFNYPDKFLDELLDNTDLIADMVDLFKIGDDKLHLPNPYDYKLNPTKKIIEIANKKMIELGIQENEEYLDRFYKELSVINNAGLEYYFLIYHDIIQQCQKMEIPTGTGRGSGVGSLLVYLLGITKIDPIKRGLIFERFLTKERVGQQLIKFFDDNEIIKGATKNAK